jgi:hypothetical protein
MISLAKQTYIKSLADRSGFIEPSRIIEVARDPNNMLHDEFEWNINRAAEKHWLEQARAFLSSGVEILIEHKNPPPVSDGPRAAATRTATWTSRGWLGLSVSGHAEVFRITSQRRAQAIQPCSSFSIQSAAREHPPPSTRPISRREIKEATAALGRRRGRPQLRRRRDEAR